MSKTVVMMYSAIGHAYFHMFTAFYFVIVLSLEVEWRRPYHQLLDLWTLGALLVGAFAIVAGWLGDRWSARGMLVVFFLGMGLCSLAAGFASSPFELLLALSGLGLFAAIYHPVGIPLVIRNSGANQGKALALNGVFGSLGAAMAGAVTGVLADAGGSSLAFALPGAVVALTGAAMGIG
ncbi:MAG: MFS transporter, partial [bacterium]